MEVEEIDLYEVLSISKDASKAEVKKAYHKAALTSHPDKVAEGDRAEAEIQFKLVSKAYEILSDDNMRELYDVHGMAAFDPSAKGAGAQEVDLEDILQQMYGMGMGGGGGMPPGFGFSGFGGANGFGAGSARPKRGRDEVQEYEITLEELYKGKTTRFASSKNVICSHCKGVGGKKNAKPMQCSVCKGSGVVIGLRTVDSWVTQERSPCGNCSATGEVFKEKDQCKKCKGKRTVEAKKMLELYIPPGSLQGDKVVLHGEADESPGQEPGDIVFTIEEKSHETFVRAGSDLLAELEVDLVEALTGLDRVVLTHLDGRGIHISTKGKVLRPQQVLKVKGEGMPVKRSDSKGDLYLKIEVKFPPDKWLKDREGYDKLRELLPQPRAPISAEVVDEVTYEPDADIEDFGAGSGDPRSGAEWEDMDDEEPGENVQCAQQ